MGTGLEFVKDLRLEEHVKKGLLTKGMLTTTGKKEFVNEILRRAKLMEEEAKPRPKGWSNPKRHQWLLDNPVSEEEKNWVRREFEAFLKKKDDEAAAEEVPGSNIRKSNCYKMRLYEAVFFEELRDALLKRNDSFSRAQLDARNLET